MIDGTDTIGKLTEKLNEGYTNLSKWLIGLSAGAIVFSIRLIEPGTPEHLILVLVYGLGCLVASIISGTIYVRLGLDTLHYNLLDLRVGSEIEMLNQKLEIEEGEEETKIKARIDDLNKISKKAKTKFKIRNNFLRFILPLHQTTFLFGIILIAIFGILYIQL